MGLSYLGVSACAELGARYNGVSSPILFIGELFKSHGFCSVVWFHSDKVFFPCQSFDCGAGVADERGGGVEAALGCFLGCLICRLVVFEAAVREHVLEHEGVAP